MKYPKFAHSFEVIATLPEALEPLHRLSANLHWTWSHEARELFRGIDRNLWEAVEHNPIRFLEKLTADRLERLAADEAFLARMRHCDARLAKYLAAPTIEIPADIEKKSNEAIAYFCAEFGLSEALPIYSGGLGVLAGDHLKAASDLGLPLVGVGLLYSRGYFRQSLSSDGWQQEQYPHYDFYEMPLLLVRGEDQKPLRVEVEMPDRIITCQIWRAVVGRVELYLLDSNILENEPADQAITDTLYGGDQEMRIRQELILGVGGMRALRAVGIDPVVCHMNEGHAAFLSLERINQFMRRFGCDYRTARKVVVSSNVFTTHTPVPAGFDLFPADLLKPYALRLLEPLGLTFDEFQRLGRLEPENEGESFNMAVFAMENANYVNGVSKLHAAVSREMFHSRWPGYPENEVPVEAITNGIHTLTWMSRPMADLFDRHIPNWRERIDDPAMWQMVRSIPDEELWEVRENLRGDLVRFLRRRLKQDLIQRGSSKSDFAGDSILDPRILTIGFARRFATYKRATMMLADRERLLAMLTHPERPIQIVIAGKSHPRDDGGKSMIQELYRFIVSGGARNRMVFLEDYDLEVARRLVQGVDVWLNNPRRPHEASGTSGMKVVPNGGLNCSVLDGWWDEAYSPELGWAIGDRLQHDDPTQQDISDAHSLYHLLETEIAPRFYHRVSSAMPKAWLQMIKGSMAELGPRFNTQRMVREYAQRFYFPAWKAYARLTSNDLAAARSANAWRERMRSEFSKVRILEVSHSASVENELGQTFEVTAKVDLNGLDDGEVRLEVLFGQAMGNRELGEYDVLPMDLVSRDGKVATYSRTVPMSRPGHRGFVVRAVPHHIDVAIPGELNIVKWEE